MINITECGIKNDLTIKEEYMKLILYVIILKK